MKYKTNYLFYFLFFTLTFILLPLSFLSADPTFINSYPYQDLFPPDFTFGGSHCCNVIEAIDGGFILEAFINANWDIAWYPQAMFFKIAENGDMEWRKCLYDEEWEGPYFNSFISNGVDRYYGVGDYFGGPTFFYVFDDSCNVLSNIILEVEDSLNVKINSMKLLDDGLIMAGRPEASVALIMKTDFEGNILWMRDGFEIVNYIPPYPAEFNSVITTSDNGFLACGNYGSQGYLLKFNAQGDTLWMVKDTNYYYTSLLEYESENYYVMSHSYLLNYNNNGILINEYLLADIGNSYQSISSLLKSNDDNLILLYNTSEGEIHKITPEGEILWQRDYLDDNENPANISMCDNKILQVNNNDIVYCGTYENYEDPEIILIRTDPEGNVPVTIETIKPNNNIKVSNYPNPFNPETTISFSLPKESKIELSVYNIKGQKVKTIVKDEFESGKHSIIWFGKDKNNKKCSSGIYFYKLKTEKFEKVKKMILLK